MSFCEVMSSQMERFSREGKDNAIASKLAGDLDAKLTSSSKQVLLQRIEFKAATKQDEQYEKLKRKYKPLNQTTAHVNGGYAQNGHEKGSAMNDDVTEPKMVLCGADKVELQWNKVKRVGPGLSNLGNTCYLNSVLQVLTYTAPLVNFLSSQEHSKECRAVGFCMMCELQRHVLRTFSHNQNESIKPLAIIQKLRCIAKHLRFGHQEDAHEFLRYVIDGMQKSLLIGLPEKLDRASKETSFIHRIFGGYYRSQVRCLMCHNTSNTFDPLMEVMLDIKHTPSIIRALQHSCKAELLDGDNLYYCLKCKKKVPANKQVLIYRPPNILTLQLKRFDSNHIFGGKITKSVDYSEYLDIRPFMTTPKGPPIRYKLYAVLVHSGYSSNSGHYYCYVRGSNNSWYNMNDSVVRQVGLNTALSQQAYLLFYSKLPEYPSHQEKKPFSPISTKPPSLQSGSTFLKTIKENDVGTPVSRNGGANRGKQLHTCTTTKVTPSVISFVSTPARPKLSFALKSSAKTNVQLGKIKKELKSPKKDIDLKEELSKPKKDLPTLSKDITTTSQQEECKTTNHLLGISTEKTDIKDTQQDDTKNVVMMSPDLKTPEPVSVSFPIRKDEKAASPSKKVKLTPLFIPRSVHAKSATNDDKHSSQGDRGGSMTSPAKATTPWKVTSAPNSNNNCIYGPMSPPSKGAACPQPSPSPALSDGSSTMGTAGDWAVKDKNLPTPGPRLPERQHAGWTVSEKSGTETGTDNGNDVTMDEDTWVESTTEKPDKSKKKKKGEKRKMKKRYEKLNESSEIGDQDSKEDNKKQNTTEETDRKREKHKSRKKKDKVEKKGEKQKLLDKKCSDDDSPLPDREPKKKRKKQDHANESEHKRQRLVDYSSNDSSDSEQCISTKQQEKKKAVHVVVHVYDGGRQDKPSRRATWDGSRDTSTVNQLLNSGKGLIGYGGNVSSWDGGPSLVDSYGDDDSENGKTRHRRDSWDEELDRGKVKKVKDKSKREKQSSNGSNFFQREQDRRSKKGVFERVSHFTRRHSAFQSRTHSSRAGYRRF